MIEFKQLKQQLLKLLFKSFHKVLIEKEQLVHKDGKTFLQHFWVLPEEVKPTDTVRYNRHLLADDHPQRYKTNDDIKDYHIFQTEEDIENILGGLMSDEDMPFIKWVDHRTVGEKRAVEEYTAGPCEAINKYLRGIFKVEDALTDENKYWNTRMLKRIIPVIPYLDRTISKFENPVPMRVYRTVSSKMLPKLVEASKTPEGIFVEDGYCSTTLIEGSFGDEETMVTMVIDVPAGKGLGAYVDPISEYGGEYEFIMARGTMLQIHSITPATKDHGAIIHMSAVGRKENINVMTPQQLSEQLLQQQLQSFGLGTKKSMVFFDLMRALGKDNPTKVLVARSVSKEGKTFIQHFWVKPDEVESSDRVVTNYHNLPENHPQKYSEIEYESYAYDLLGDFGDDTKPFGHWWGKMPKTQKQSLGDYTYDSEPMNTYLRYDTVDNYHTQDKLEKDRQRIEKVISNFEIPQPLTVHRVVGLEMLDQFKQAQNAGGIFKDSAFCSTSVIKGSFGSHHNLQMVIHVPAGKGIGAWVAPCSEFPEENELLLNHGTLFEVHSITPATKDHGPIVELTVVGRDPTHP